MARKAKGASRIFAVLGQIEVHAADQVPRGVPALQEFLDPAFRLGQFDAECGVQFLPEGAEGPLAVRYSAPVMGGAAKASWSSSAAGGAGTCAFRCDALGIRLRAEGGHVPCAEFSPVGEDRRKRGPGFSRSELEKTMARSTRESIPQALSKLGVKCQGVILLDQAETTVRSQDRGKENRTHAENLPASPTTLQWSVSFAL